MGNAVTYNRLARCGLRPAAESYKEEVRQRRKAAGDDRATAVQIAEDAMLGLFMPICEAREADQAQVSEAKAETREAAKQAQKAAGARLSGLPADIDSLLDPDYAEADPGKQLRDGLLWVAFEWMRVVHDSPEGPMISVERASAPPPNAFALFALATYSLAPADKRRELISRSLSFATRGYEISDDAASPDGFPDGFLDGL